MSKLTFARSSRASRQSRSLVCLRSSAFQNLTQLTSVQGDGDHIPGIGWAWRDSWGVCRKARVSAMGNSTSG